MNIARHGIILFTEKYPECVSFYQSLFDLKVMFQLDNEDSKLTCLEFGGAYLMIETYGHASSTPKTTKQNPTKLRFNIHNIDDAIAKLKNHKVDFEVKKYNWGTVINIVDPDGNYVSLREETTFANQITL